jgi:hypothetical protein
MNEWLEFCDSQEHIEPQSAQRAQRVEDKTWRALRPLR